MKRCVRCVMPDTKPDLWFDENGVCSACLNFENRKYIDWEGKRQELNNFLESYRSKSYYDCIVPVSGGKDSHFQVMKMLEMGMHPLAVCARTDDFTDIGRRNLENLKKLGVDCIEVSVNPNIRKKIARQALVELGDISWPEHVTIFTIPVRIALQFNIHLIVWGENPQNEYGGPAMDSDNPYLTKDWLQEFGGLLGMRPSDLDFSEQDLLMYTYPSNEDLERADITGFFLGYFFPWDGMQNAIDASARGYEWSERPIETHYKRYENLDNYQTGIHDYFKYLKYGFGRTTDLVCIDIRHGRCTREEGMKVLWEYEGTPPYAYLGKPLSEILQEIDMSVKEFLDVCDRFTNWDLFEKTNKFPRLKGCYVRE